MMQLRRELERTQSQSREKLKSLLSAGNRREEPWSRNDRALSMGTFLSVLLLKRFGTFIYYTTCSFLDDNRKPLNLCYHTLQECVQIVLEPKSQQLGIISSVLRTEYGLKEGACISSQGSQSGAYKFTMISSGWTGSDCSRTVQHIHTVAGWASSNRKH
jgi:hypothetical protein